MFDLSGVSAEELADVGILQSVLGIIDTENYEYSELFNEINVNTGGIGTSLELYNNVTRVKEKEFKATFEIKGKALYSQLEKTFAMMAEILTASKLDDTKRIREILAMLKSRLLMKFQSSGHTTAALRALSYACLLYTSYTIEDGKIVKAEPDKESPKGRLCPRGALVPDILYGEERIKRPLIRVGERGEGKFRECSWEEAVDKAAELLKKTADTYGGRSLASYYGRGILGLPVTRLCGKGDGSGKGTFLINLGSVNDMNCSSICNLASSTVTPGTLMGLNTRMMVQEIEESDYIISWGKNSASDDGPQVMLHRIKEAQKRGAKLIVIDPRQEGLGKIADWWIPITPGSDGALALAILKMIISSGRYDHEFVEKYTRGFEEFNACLLYTSRCV